jgi:hypothetical protein
MIEIKEIPFWMESLMFIIDCEIEPPDTYTITNVFDLFAKELIRSTKTEHMDKKEEGNVAARCDAMCEWAVGACGKSKADAWTFSSLFRLLGLLGWFGCSEGGERVRDVLRLMESTCTLPTGAFFRVLLNCIQDLPHNGDHLVLLDDVVSRMQTNGIMKDEHMHSLIYSIQTRKRLPVFYQLLT